MTRSPAGKNSIGPSVVRNQSALVACFGMEFPAIQTPLPGQECRLGSYWLALEAERVGNGLELAGPGKLGRVLNKVYCLCVRRRALSCRTVHTRIRTEMHFISGVCCRSDV